MGQFKTIHILLTELVNAKTPKEREASYRMLEKVGIDRMTANVLMSAKDEWMEKEDSE